MFNAVNEYCLNRIVRLSEHHAVLATEDIVEAGNGVKLWAKGKPVSSELQHRLLKRKLAKPLETALTVENAVSMNEVVQACFDRMETDPLYDALAGTQKALSLLRTLSRIQLPAPVRLLLTAVREHDPAEYDNNVRVLLIVAAIAAELNASDRESMVLMHAALLHDFGLLYIDPSIVAGGGKLAPKEWRQMASHPIIGKLIVSEMTALPSLVGECVALHHERLDGSGYPNCLDQVRVHRLGSWLALADAVAAIETAASGDAAARIFFALRIAPEIFDQQAITAILNRLRGQNLDLLHRDISGEAHLNAQKTMEKIEKTLAVFREMRLLASAQSVVSVIDFADAVLANVRKSLFSSGVVEACQYLPEAQLQEEMMQAEIGQVVREIDWRLRNLARNLYLRADTGGNSHLLALFGDAITLLDGGESSFSQAISGLRQAQRQAA